MSDLTLSALAPNPAQSDARQYEALRKAVTALEANFLSEMLKSAGFGEARRAFGGGVAEEQFSSFLRQEQATAMAEAGGIGLAEAMFAALTRGEAK